MTDFKVLSTDNGMTTVEDWMGYIHEVTQAQVTRATKIDALSKYIYARDGGLFGEVVFWTDDETEAEDFGSRLFASGLSYEAQEDGFKHCPDVKYIFIVA